MPSDSNPLLYMGLLAALIAINAFFAMSELAIVSLNDNKLRRQAQDGDKKAQILMRLISEPSRFLATIQVGVTLSGFLASAVAADTFVGYIMHYLENTPLMVALGAAPVRVAALTVVTLLLSYVTLVFGELVPKRIAMHNYERISLMVARPLAGMYAAARPFVALLSGSTNAVLRLLGIDPDDKPDAITEEEIRMMIDVGSEDGNIPESDADMLNKVFEFDDTTVVEIMTPRTEVEAIEERATLDEIMALAISTGYSRLPVYERDLDSVKGVLYVKDLLELVIRDPDEPFVLKDFTREDPLFVFESTSCKNLLETFKSRKLHMAVVVDEYGGMSGIVTMEDLLEAIVGNIQDEYDDEPEEIEELSPGVYMLDGLTPYEAVADLFGLPYHEDEIDFETLGGHILSLMSHIPAADEHPTVILDGVQFTVVEMDERRIARVRAERLNAEAEQQDE
jgi:putative hemolysin